MKKLFVAIAAILITTGAGCASAEVPATPPGTTPKADMAAPIANTITVGHFVFEPTVLTVKAGEQVAWLHNDNVAHTVVSAGLFNSRPLARGDKFEFIFAKPGEYAFYCGIHPSMTGKIIVK